MRGVIPSNRNISDFEFLTNEIQNTKNRLTECLHWQDVGLNVFWQKYVGVEEKVARLRQQLLQNMCDEIFDNEVEE